MPAADMVPQKLSEMVKLNCLSLGDFFLKLLYFQNKYESWSSFLKHYINTVCQHWDTVWQKAFLTAGKKCLCQKLDYRNLFSKKKCALLAKWNLSTQLFFCQDVFFFVLLPLKHCYGFCIIISFSLMLSCFDKI